MKIQLKKKRLAVSPVIATLLLIAIAVAAAIIVYAFVTGLIGGLTTSSSGLVVTSGSLTIPGGSGTGSLIVSVKNSASNPIAQITVGVDAADVGVTANSGLGQYTAGGPAFTIYGPSGTLAIGQSTSGEASTTGASAGSTYTFTITVYFTNAPTTPVLSTFSVTAQV